MNDFSKIKEEFPYLKTGKIYLNHAAISPLPKFVKKKIDDFLQIRHETDIEPFYKTLSASIGAKEKLAKILGGEEKLLSWTSNVSDAFNILANGINWKYGDEIILNDIEFPSNVYPFLNLSKQGVNIKFAQSRDGIVDVEDINKLVTQKTRLISISMVQFLSGYRADLKSIGEICSNRDIIFCVDGIQGIGAVETDVKDYGVDFFAGGSHKWLMGLQGLGYFYISQKLLEILEQKNVGWTSVKNPWKLLNYDLELQDGAKKFENGTLPRIAIITLDASLSFFFEVGINEIEKSVIENSLYLRNNLMTNGFNVILGNIGTANTAGIVSFIHENSEKIFKGLEQRNVICSLREGVIRLSPHFYNTKEELDYVVSELKEILAKK